MFYLESNRLGAEVSVQNLYINSVNEVTESGGFFYFKEVDNVRITDGFILGGQAENGFGVS